ncbi:MAG TPA: hypothetical protein VFW50_06110 [Streptosporangiaceae bacterium]|nr:hypothetical protein [Streptosporangiaceae bacterium]
MGAALCASPPLLHPALTGRAVVLPELRAACAEAVARLLRFGPELVVVVGPAPVTGEWGPDEWFDPAAFAPGVGSGRAAVSGATAGGAAVSGTAVSGTASGGTGRGLLPLPLGLGAMLLDQGGYRGPRRLIAVGQDEPTGTCAALGAEIATGAARTALLVMGDGSARRTLKAPGHLDPRAEPFDAHVERAVRAGRLGALLDLDEALARDLMVTGRPAWQVLAGAMPDGAGANGSGADDGGMAGSGADGAGVVGGEVAAAGVDGALATEVLYRDDPFGVAYLVACLYSRFNSARYRGPKPTEKG